MKALVLFYSKTGNTKEIAVNISEVLNCDIEEIFDVKPRGFIRSGFESFFKIMPKIKQTEIDPKNYDMVIIGTPVWAGNIASPVRTYLFQNNEKLGKVAFFCTMKMDNSDKVFLEMERVCESNPAACLSLTEQEIKQEKHIKKLKEFITKIKKKVS
ncbi:MAG: flavodoxin domain-containing protein [Candidatus Nanoarchaeia archaeon]|nr:flavodoxin domain-containing protein [Candidatus Nanoarchaeia archaeon]